MTKTRALWLGALVALVAALVAAGAQADSSAEPVATAVSITAEPEPNETVLPREVYRPPAGVKPRGAVLVIHGGGWQGGQAKHMHSIRADARRIASWGYVTWSIDYRSGTQSILDVHAEWRKMRKRYPRLATCAFGTSAGGNLAMLLAARARPLRCAMSDAGPTDLETLKFRTVKEFFPTEALRRKFSPVVAAQKGKLDDVRILIGHLAEDPLVPVTQSRRLREMLPGTKLNVLFSGLTPFVHGRADGWQLGEHRLMQQRFLGHVLPDPPEAKKKKRKKKRGKRSR